MIVPAANWTILENAFLFRESSYIIRKRGLVERLTYAPRGLSDNGYPFRFLMGRRCAWIFDAPIDHNFFAAPHRASGAGRPPNVTRATQVTALVVCPV